MSNPETINSPDYPLPVVTQETGDASVRDMAELGEERYFEEAFNRLNAGNPRLTEVIIKYVDAAYDTPEEKSAAKKSVIIFHELLRKQAAADAMDQSIS